MRTVGGRTNSPQRSFGDSSVSLRRIWTKLGGSVSPGGYRTCFKLEKHKHINLTESKGQGDLFIHLPCACIHTYIYAYMYIFMHIYIYIYAKHV